MVSVLRGTLAAHPFMHLAGWPENDEWWPGLPMTGLRSRPWAAEVHADSGVAQSGVACAGADEWHRRGRGAHEGQLRPTWVAAAMIHRTRMQRKSSRCASSSVGFRRRGRLRGRACP